MNSTMNSSAFMKPAEMRRSCRRYRRVVKVTTANTIAGDKPEHEDVFGNREIDAKDGWEVENRVLERAVGHVLDNDLACVEAFFGVFLGMFDVGFGLTHLSANLSRGRQCDAAGLSTRRRHRNSHTYTTMK